MKTMLLFCSIMLFRTATAEPENALSPSIHKSNGLLFGAINDRFSSTYADDTTVVPKNAVRVQNTQKIQYGVASFYHSKFEGRKTSSGQPYDGNKYTAAHNGLPLGTWVKVTNIRNKKSVYVKINDRMHHRNTRLIDLSKIAAKDLGYIGRGLTKVKVEVLGKKKPAKAKIGVEKKPATTGAAIQKKSS
jgi:rare lipoprotein A